MAMVQLVVGITKLHKPASLVVRFVTSNANRFRAVDGTLVKLQGSKLVKEMYQSPVVTSKVRGVNAAAAALCCSRLGVAPDMAHALAGAGRGCVLAMSVD